MRVKKSRFSRGVSLIRAIGSISPFLELHMGGCRDTSSTIFKADRVLHCAGILRFITAFFAFDRPWSRLGSQLFLVPRTQAPERFANGERDISISNGNIEAAEFETGNSFTVHRERNNVWEVPLVAEYGPGEAFQASIFIKFLQPVA